MCRHLCRDFFLPSHVLPCSWLLEWLGVVVSTGAEPPSFCSAQPPVESPYLLPPPILVVYK